MTIFSQTFFIVKHPIPLLCFFIFFPVVFIYGNEAEEKWQIVKTTEKMNFDGICDEAPCLGLVSLVCPARSVALRLSLRHPERLARFNLLPFLPLSLYLLSHG
jgi:hypothetical protein